MIRECTIVSDYESVRGIIKDLEDTMDHLKTTYGFKRGIGLSAPQIGESFRISVAESSNGQRYILINPEILENSSEKKPIREGCISFFEYRANVSRYEYVKVKAFDKKYFVEGNKDFAMLLQHEIDHLNGILYVDHLPNGDKDLVLSDKA